MLVVSNCDLPLPLPTHPLSLHHIWTLYSNQIWSSHTHYPIFRYSQCIQRPLHPQDCYTCLQGTAHAKTQYMIITCADCLNRWSPLSLLAHLTCLWTLLSVPPHLQQPMPPQTASLVPFTLPLKSQPVWKQVVIQFILSRDSPRLPYLRHQVNQRQDWGREAGCRWPSWACHRDAKEWAVGDQAEEASDFRMWYGICWGRRTCPCCLRHPHVHPSGSACAPSREHISWSTPHPSPSRQHLLGAQALCV